jgi:hypothetical protein
MLQLLHELIVRSLNQNNYGISSTKVINRLHLEVLRVFQVKYLLHLLIKPCSLFIKELALYFMNHIHGAWHSDRNWEVHGMQAKGVS